MKCRLMAFKVPFCSVQICKESTMSSMSLLDTLEKDKSAIKRLKEQVQKIVYNVDKFEVPGRFGDISHTEIKSLKSDLLIKNKNGLILVLSSDMMGATHSYNAVSVRSECEGIYLSQGFNSETQVCFCDAVHDPMKFTRSEAQALLELSDESLFQYSTMYDNDKLRCMYAVKHYTQEFSGFAYLLVRTNTRYIDMLEDYIDKVVNV